MSVAVEDCVEYLGDNNVWSAGDITAALESEAAVQARLCLVPEDGDPALDQALMRRVAVSLAMRPLPLGYQPSMTESGMISAIRVGGGDREIDRLESGFRRIPIA